MTVSVLDLNNAEETVRWDAFVDKQGTLYHNSHWASILRDIYGFKPYYLFVEDNGEIKSVLPLFHVKAPFLKDELVSIPHVESAGIINLEFYLEYLDFIKKTLKIPKIKIFQNKDAIGDFAAATGQAVMIAGLADTKEMIIPNIKSGRTRNEMRAALKKNFQVTIANDDGSLRDFYRVYLKKMREFGTPPHRFAYIKKISESFGSLCFTIVVRQGDEPVGAGFYIFFNDYLYNIYLTVEDKYLRHKVGHLIEFKAMEMGVENGCRYLVLGRCEEDGGNFSYKSKLGGSPVKLYIHTFTLTANGYEGVLDSPVKQRYSFIAPLWSKLPSLVTDNIGVYIRKWVY
ncbi:MAG: GNAT family N-acetyltransferase [Nitrospirae bacterium]|nr:GNAT family N-acetyltransferase [Nitrospirota bacterium]